jgi:hypothetical protein
MKENQETKTRQLNFKPIGLIASTPNINIYDYGPICEGMPNNCYFVTSTYETGILDLPMYVFTYVLVTF